MSKDRPIPRMVDVARAAGVHQTTVSRALRGDPALPEETRKRLVELAEEMGYRRNPMVSALIAERRRGRPSGQGDVIAVVSQGGTDPTRWRSGSQTYTRLFSFLKTHANRMGYRLEEFTLLPAKPQRRRLENILLSRGIRGILLTPMPLNTEKLEFDFSSFACAAMRNRLNYPKLDRVSPDYFQAMEAGILKLNASGHTKIGFLTNINVDERVRHRSLGAFEAMHFLNPGGYVPPLIIDKLEKGPFIKWMKTHRPDAVVAAIHIHYQRAIRWLREEGWKVPEELSVICLDCHAETDEAGMIHQLDAEAAHLIDLLARKVESANFGIPHTACEIDIPSEWRDGEGFASRKAVKTASQAK